MYELAAYKLNRKKERMATASRKKEFRGFERRTEKEYEQHRQDLIEGRKSHVKAEKSRRVRERKEFERATQVENRLRLKSSKLRRCVLLYFVPLPREELQFARARFMHTATLIPHLTLCQSQSCNGAEPPKARESSFCTEKQQDRRRPNRRPRRDHIDTISAANRCSI